MSHGTNTDPRCGDVAMIDGTAYDCTKKRHHQGDWHTHLAAARQAGRVFTALVSWQHRIEGGTKDA